MTMQLSGTSGIDEMLRSGIEQFDFSNTSLQDKIDQGRLLGAEVLGDVELSERESLIARRMFLAAYRAGVESTKGTDFSEREMTIIAAVSRVVAPGLSSMEVK